MKREARNLLFWIVGIILLVFIIGQFFFPSDYKTIGYQTFKQQLREGRIKKVVMDGEELRGEFSPRPITDIKIDGQTVKNPTLKQLSKALDEGKSVQVERDDTAKSDSSGEVKSGAKQYPEIAPVGQEKKVRVENFKLKLPSTEDSQVQSLIDQSYEVFGMPEQENQGRKQTPWVQIILYAAVPIFILLIFWFYLSSRMGGQAGGGIMNIGKMKGEVFDKETQVDTTFGDVAGLESAKEDLKEVIQFLKDPKRFHRLGGKVPKGVLLVGPPGTGKTLMARAVAGEANVPFFSLTGSSFMEMFVGVGASRVRDLFDSAKENKPAIIFIDELESVGRKRGAGVGGGHDEREQTLNQLLAEMDGFEPRDNIVVMGATNRPDILDQAILRPGRFDREITVDMPTVKEREQILDVHVRDVPLADDINLAHIAKGTPGFSGADLENLVNEAAIKAAREEDTKVRMPYFEYAMDRIMLGREREGMMLSEEDKRLVAYHEAGHAIVAQYSEHADPLFKVTIIPRRRSLGCTKQIPQEEKYNYSREYLLARIQVVLGGRAAEQLIFDTFTTGGGDDLKKAKEISSKMVCQYGMSEKVGHVSLGNGDDEVFLGQELGSGRDYSEKTAEIVDEEISEITSSCFENAVQTIKDHREELDRLAEALIERESLERKEIYELLGLEDELEELEEEEAEQGGGPPPPDPTTSEEPDEADHGTDPSSEESSDSDSAAAESSSGDDGHPDSPSGDSEDEDGDQQSRAGEASQQETIHSSEPVNDPESEGDDVSQPSEHDSGRNEGTGD